MGGPMCMGYNASFCILIWFGALLWFVLFSLLVLLRLDKIIKVLDKK